LDDRNDKKDLYLLVGEVKGKLDQIALQLNSYFSDLSKQIAEANKRMERIEKRLEEHQSDIDVLKTRDKMYRAAISALATFIILVMVDLFHKVGII